jgi:tRNA(Leu) C34 or U34 (ribose-2'-O)-methylase TrmL
MDYPPQIEKLLEKYWNTETSVLEERELHNYFVLHPEHMDAHSAYFLMLSEDAEIEASVRPQAIKKDITQPVIRRIISVAAAVTLIVAAGFLIQNQLAQGNESNQSAQVYTVKETDEAYAQAKQALLLVSQKMKASKEKASSKIKIIEPYTTILK